MKKFFSIVFFLLMIAVFVFEVYCGITGTIDVNRQYAELAARGASGHEYLGVGIDILVLGTIFLSIVGSIISIISWKIAQYRAFRIISGVTCLLFLTPIFMIVFYMMF